MMEPHEAERPDCDERSRHEHEHEHDSDSEDESGAQAALDAIENHTNATWHDTGLRDILTAKRNIDNNNHHSGPQSRAHGHEDSQFTGHDMSVKLDSAGCRIIVMNVAKKLLETIDEIKNPEDPKKNKTIRYVNYVTQYINDMEGDITIINEPGGVHSAEHIIHAAADQAGMEAVVAGTNHSVAAGLVIMMGAKWRKVRTQHKIFKDSNAEVRALTMEFKAAQPRQHGQPLDRMMVIAVYGYNGPASRKNKANSKKMWGAIAHSVNDYKARFPMASVVLAGDINAAKSSQLDTNRVHVT
jgi:hypothetical protein